MTQLTRSFLLVILVAMTVCSGLMAGYVAYSLHLRASDAYVRQRTVMLEGNTGGCTGVEVQAPISRHIYVLTAGHCYDLLNAEGRIRAVTEDGASRDVKFIALDGNSDLMLLSSPDNKGVLLAKTTELYEKIHTITHGGGMPAYRTDGELLDEHIYPMPIFAITGSDLLVVCARNPANTIIPTPFGLLCAVVRNQTVGTAAVIPGSSGGPVFDDAGSLVGIVSAYGGGFNYYVRLVDIKEFLKGK